MVNTIENIQHNRLVKTLNSPDKISDSIMAIIEVPKLKENEMQVYLRFYKVSSKRGNKCFLNEELIILSSKCDNGLTLETLPEISLVTNNWMFESVVALFDLIEKNKRNIFYRASLLRKDTDLNAIEEKIIKTFSSIEGILNILFDLSYFDEM